MTKKIPKQPGEKGRVSRRQFARTIAALATAAPLMASTVADAQTPPAKEAPAPPKPEATPSPQAQQQPSPVAKAYGEVAAARFGDKLSPEQLAQVRRSLEGTVRNAERLRAVKLQNADEPDFVFIA